MRNSPVGVILAVGASLAMSANAFGQGQAGLVVGGFDASRGGPWSYLDDGSELAGLRDAIEGGFPGVSFDLTPILSDEYLAGVDVVLLASAADGGTGIDPLTPAEQLALRSFVEAGGGAVLFVDNEFYAGDELANESLIDPFGLDTRGSGHHLVNVLDPLAHPVTNGPFGIVGTYNELDGGWFDSLGPDAVSLATIAANGEAALAVIDHDQLTLGSGGVVFFGDTSMIWDFIRTPATETLVLNAIAFAVPEPSAILLLAVGPIILRRHLRLRASGRRFAE